VGSRSEVGVDPRHGRYLDDAAALAAHGVDGALRPEEYPAEVDGQNSPPRAGGRLGDQLGEGYPGVVDEDVETLASGADRLDDRRPSRFVGDIQFGVLGHRHDPSRVVLRRLGESL
jgi:hypothetical protein